MHALGFPHKHLASRRELIALLVAVGLIASLAVACGGGSEASNVATPTSAPTDLPDGDEEDISNDFDGSSPPALTVTVGDMSIEAGLGSFCYGRLCADAIGNITPVDALLADAGQLTAILALEMVSEVSVTATSSSSLESQTICTRADGEPPTGPICEGGSVLVAWTGRSTETIVLAAVADEATIDIDISTLEPGIYVVDVFVRFVSGGDAAYGVLLDVLE